jgi:signal peptidase I
MQFTFGGPMRWSPVTRHLVKGATFVALSLGLAVLIFHFLLQPFQVAGLSMSPTLDDQDYLLVDRVFFRSTGIQRGDLVVFKLENDPRFMIKRVLGLPGEEVSGHDGVLTVNGGPVPSTFLGLHRLPDFGPVLVPEGAYFCMGDNPEVSLDSRTFGAVKRESIYGRPFLRYLPLERSGLLNRTKP